MLLSLALIFLCGLALGGIFWKLHLPQLLGMLLTGILLGPYVLNLLESSILGISADLRQIALIIILTRAGLNLDLEDLKKVGRPAALLCFVPAAFEIAGMLLLAPRLLGSCRYGDCGGCGFSGGSCTGYAEAHGGGLWDPKEHPSDDYGRRIRR